MGKKYKNEEVKKIFNDKGYELMEDYINVKTKMKVKDNNGYLLNCSLDLFLNGTPQIFHKCNPYTIENIKLWIKLNNKKYKLKSEVYVNNSDYLLLECPIHGEFKMSWNNMLHGNNCSKCYDEVRGDYKIFSYEYVKKYIEHECSSWKKLKLLSTQYIGVKDKLIIEDEIGYKYSLSFDNIKQSYRKKLGIDYVSKYNDFSIENIRLWILLNNKPFKLISDEYIGNTSELIFKCNKEHIFKTSWSSILQGCGCNMCSKHKKITSEDIEELINITIKDKFNFVLLNVNIKNNKKYLTLVDNEGYKYYISYSNLKQYYINNTSKPTRFGKGNMYTVENINLWLKLNGKPFQLIEEKFITATSKMKFKCSENHIFKTTWNDVYSGGASCSTCGQSKGEIRIENWLLLNNFVKIYDDKYVNLIENPNNYICQKTYEELLGLGGGNLSYDFYLPKYNLLIEYQGEFHDGNGNYYMKQNLEKQKEHDRRKKQYAIDNNINLLEIWYWDFDNIEKILKKELSSVDLKEVV